MFHLTRLTRSSNVSSVSLTTNVAWLIEHRTTQHNYRPFGPTFLYQARCQETNLLCFSASMSFISLHPCISDVCLSKSLLNTTTSTTIHGNLFQALITFCVKEKVLYSTSPLNFSPLILKLCPLVFDISILGKKDSTVYPIYATHTFIYFYHVSPQTLMIQRNPSLTHLSFQLIPSNSGNILVNLFCILS